MGGAIGLVTADSSISTIIDSLNYIYQPVTEWKKNVPSCSVIPLAGIFSNIFIIKNKKTLKNKNI